MRIEVQRSKWANPNFNPFVDHTATENHGASILRNEQGNMCCLGFAMLQCGFSEQSIDGIGTPEGLDVVEYDALTPEQRKFADAFVFRGESDYPYEPARPMLSDTDLVRDAVAANDDASLTLEEREIRLIEVFARYGHEMVFVP